MSDETTMRAALSELVAAITAPDASPIETEETPFGDDHKLVENPRIVAAIKAAHVALHRVEAGPDLARGDSEMYSVNIHTDLKVLKLEHIRRALAHCRGNRSEAARILGIDRKTMYRLLPVDSTRCEKCGSTTTHKHPST